MFLGCFLVFLEGLNMFLGGEAFKAPDQSQNSPKESS